MFKITICDFERGSGTKPEKLPFAYSEHGITMLAGLLRNKTAIQVSLSIVDAFVEMRRFISAYGKTFERLTTVEYKLLEHDRKFDELFDLIQLPGLPKQGIFFKGQIYDAFSLVIKIIGEARKALVICQPVGDANSKLLDLQEYIGIRQENRHLNLCGFRGGLP